MRIPQTDVLARIFVLVILGQSTAGCELVGGIFKAGIWVGALGIVLFAVLVFMAASKLKR